MDLLYFNMLLLKFWADIFQLLAVAPKVENPKSLTA